MSGKYARIEAISPRPEGRYRFALRMRADAALPVTINAFGVWDMFDVTTAWQEFAIMIDAADGDYIDIYPLGDTALYIEKTQLTYGKAVYEWRPAPEDDTAYEWTSVAMDEVTVSNIRDIVSFTDYYRLADSAEPAPVKPTVYPPPSPWDTEEPLGGIYEATASTTGHGISAAAVDTDTFTEAVGGAAGTYRFTYDGANWNLDGHNVSLRDYGVSVIGTADPGDSVAVLLSILKDKVLYRCSVTLYSDGSFSWGEVVRASSYDAAMAAISTSTRYQTQVEQLLTSWTARVRATTLTNDEENPTVVEDLLGMIQVTESTVSSLIDEVRQSDDGLNERITSLQTQTTENITNTFTEAKQYADDQYGATKDYVTTAQSWQRFSADGIEQGKLGSPFKSLLSNSELGFYENNQRVAYINNNKLMITNGEILNSLVIGNFVWAVNEHGLGLIYNGSGA